MMKNKLQKYDKYKPSGLDWLGDIPEWWELVKFNDFAKIIEGQVNPQNEPYKSMILIAPNHIEKNTGQIIETKTADEQGADSGKYLFSKGDIVYSKIRPYLRKACLVNFNGICSADMYPIRLNKYKSNNDYFLKFILCDGFSDFMTMRSNRVAMPKVNREDFQECLFLQPPLQTQTLIANYLDTQTAKIDQEIQLLTGKVAKYKQLKQTLISNTVTKGLDKSAKLKPSGVKWIGDIPEGWDVRRLKDCFDLVSSGIDYFEGEKEYLSTKSLGVNEIIEPEDIITFENRASRANMQPKVNTGWFAKMSNTNKTYIFTDKSECEKYILSTGLCAFKINIQIPQFVKYYLMSDYFNFEKEMYSYGTTQISINEGNIVKINLIKPPLETQQQIANYLYDQTGKIDQIITTIQAKILKLKEFRKVLINDVVTGKLRIEN